MDDRADVIVVGGGPAGIAAACAATERGRSAILVDESPQAGGQIWRHRPPQVPRAARPWLARLARSGARVLAGAAVVDVERGDGVTLTVEQEGQGREIHGGALVLATGARERFIPFPGWTLPHVTGIGGAQALLKAGTSFAGRQVVIAGSGPLLLPVSAALAQGGAHVALIAEQAPLARVVAFTGTLWRQPAKLVQAALYRAEAAGARYRAGQWVARAMGDGRVEAVEVTDGSRTVRVACDLLCTGFGLVANVELAALLGCRVEAGYVSVDSMQGSSVPGVWCAGEVTGVAGVEAALVEGLIAGAAAAEGAGVSRRTLARRDAARKFAGRLARAFELRDELRGLADAATVLCRCEDVTCGLLQDGWTPRQAKLYTRLGMGPCQGRICGPAAEFLQGWATAEPRPPTSVATIASLARRGES